MTDDEVRLVIHARSGEAFGVEDMDMGIGHRVRLNGADLFIDESEAVIVGFDLAEDGRSCELVLRPIRGRREPVWMAKHRAATARRRGLLS